MKNLYILLLFVPFFIFGNNIKPKPSKIDKVTIYLEGAAIERSVSINLTPGENIFLFNDLSPDIDENSIQISGLKDASILSLSFDLNSLEKKILSEEYKVFKLQLEGLLAEKNSIQNTIIGYEQELQLLQNNQRLNSDATNLSLDQVREMSVYYRQRITEIKNAIYSEQKRIKDLDQKIIDHSNELLKLDDAKKEERGEITVKLDSKKAANLVLKLQYNIENAGWFPLYDIKAKSTSTPIEIAYKANVYQQSGCDWDNVNIILSTGDPLTNNIKPIISPKYLNFNFRKYNNKPVRRSNYKYNPTIKKVSGTVTDDTGLPLPGANIIAEGTSRGTQSDFDGNYSLDVNGVRDLSYSYVGFDTERIPVYANTMNVSLQAGSVLEEVVITGYSKKDEEKYSSWVEKRAFGGDDDVHQVIRGASSGIAISEDDVEYTKETGITTTRFEIREKYTIKSNAEITVIEIDKFDLPATYQYYAAPELNENVFLTATIKNWEKLDLLQGEANVYFEGSYSGKSLIDPYATTDSLSLSLGIDPNVIIERERLDNFKSKSFFGSNKIVDRGYKITLKNNKKTPITCILEDRIPISQNKEIKVEDIETADAGYNDKTGIMKWKLKLESKASIDKEFTYTVKYPKYKKINL